ncbi:sigma-E factor negative regulatory protein [Aquisalimonas sp.]|uniref:sigma-E factor negative regulatory protein n=1 Tax=Aquisalimonas sp. TaxID=1872621 RepID=UPI0025BD9348|nr:sigma-E factor negative regulatory protein [Aquisalimonas sp.]
MPLTKPYAQQVSALADEELPQSELDLLVRQCSRSDDIAERLGRYAIIREALHRNLPAQVDPGLAHRIACALEDEPTHQRPMTVRSRRWTRPMAGVAVAASVALVAIAIWPEQSPSPEQQPIQTASVPAADQAAGQPVRTENIQWDRLDSDIQARLEEYAVTPGERVEPQLGILPRPVGVSSRRLED